MIRISTFATAAFIVMASSAAMAGQCPKMAAAIDEALANTEVSEELRVQIVELRDKGMAQHEAGNHSESEATLAEAQALIPN
jgi:hypothetical protein